MSDLWRATPTSPANISESFTSQEFTAALKHLKPEKAPRSDSIFLELITHGEAELKSWLCGFLSSCVHHIKFPKILTKALVVAIPKPKKPVEDSKSYRLIPLLCVPYNRGVKLVSPWGHIVCWELCRGPHEIFDLEITTSLSNDLSNAALSEDDLQKKVFFPQVFQRHRLFFEHRSPEVE